MTGTADVPKMPVWQPVTQTCAGMAEKTQSGVSGFNGGY